MQITNGSVGFSRVVKVEDFGVNKKAEVSLSFTLGDGEDAVAAIDTVSKLVVDKTTALLGGGKAIIAAQAGLDPAKVAAATGEQKKNAGPRKPKTETPPATQAAADPAAVEDNSAAELVAAAKAASAPADASAVTDDEFAAPATTAKSISDQDLHSAMMKKNEAIKNAVAIRTLVGTFAPEGNTAPFTAQQIPQERRQEFLTKLDALKAA